MSATRLSATRRCPLARRLTRLTAASALVLVAALLTPPRRVAQNQCERVIGQLEAANNELNACRQTQRELERDVRAAQKKQLDAQDDRDKMEKERDEAKRKFEDEQKKLLAATQAKKEQDGII